MNVVHSEIWFFLKRRKNFNLFVCHKMTKLKPVLLLYHYTITIQSLFYNPNNCFKKVLSKFNQPVQYQAFDQKAHITTQYHLRRDNLFDQRHKVDREEVFFLSIGSIPFKPFSCEQSLFNTSALLIQFTYGILEDLKFMMMVYCSSSAAAMYIIYDEILQFLARVLTHIQSKT